MNGKHRSLLKLEKNLFSKNGARFVIANSAMVRDEIVKNYNYPATEIEVIPNGYDAPPHSSALREQRRAELNIGSDDFVALFAGSGWGRKGLSAAVAAVQAVHGVTLLVAGRGNSGVYSGAHDVRFLGARVELQPDFSAADVFILPTIYDPFSNACLEAWASGLPVITTSANGFAEVLAVGEDGTVVLPGDINALSAALQFWKANGRAAATREICRARAMRYSVAENTRRTLAAISRAKRK
jgi:UDP-glucose:(heptosyl)LPS alpha-1,3-glucosyltransferase